MLYAHGTLFLLRTPLVTLRPWSTGNHMYNSVWLTVLSFEAQLFTISIAFILLAMTKERGRNRVETASLDLVDMHKDNTPTTGATLVASLAAKSAAA